MTRVVVSDVEVLTAGTRYDQEKARDGQPIPTSVVTLLVTPSDAERIALAASEGEVMLTLRNPMDRKPTETTGIRTAALLGQAPAAAACRAGRPSAAAPRSPPRRSPRRSRSRRFTRSRPFGPPNVQKRLSVNVHSLSFDAARLDRRLRVAPAGGHRAVRSSRRRAPSSPRPRMRVRSSRACS